MTKISTERLLRVHAYISTVLILLLCVAVAALYAGQQSVAKNIDRVGSQVSDSADKNSDNFSGVFTDLDSLQRSIDSTQSSVEHVCQTTGTALC